MCFLIGFSGIVEPTTRKRATLAGKKFKLNPTTVLVISLFLGLAAPVAVNVVQAEVSLAKPLLKLKVVVHQVQP